MTKELLTWSLEDAKGMFVEFQDVTNVDFEYLSKIVLLLKERLIMIQ